MIRKSGNGSFSSFGRVKEAIRYVCTFSLSPVARFDPRDCFKIGETDGVKIHWIGGGFQTHCLGKIEESVPAATFKIHKLRAPIPEPIIAVKLGGLESIETHLAHLWMMLKEQVGQPGALPRDNGNIFFMRNVRGRFVTVFAAWRGDLGGWMLEAGYGVVEHPLSEDGNYVVSRSA